MRVKIGGRGGIFEGGICNGEGRDFRYLLNTLFIHLEGVSI